MSVCTACLKNHYCIVKGRCPECIEKGFVTIHGDLPEPLKRIGPNNLADVMIDAAVEAGMGIDTLRDIASHLKEEGIEIKGIESDEVYNWLYNNGGMLEDMVAEYFRRFLEDVYGYITRD